MRIDHRQIVIDMSCQYLTLRKILYDLPVSFINRRLAVLVGNDIHIKHRLLSVRQVIIILEIQLYGFGQLSDLSGIQRCHECFIKSRNLQIMFNCLLIPCVHFCAKLLSLDPVCAKSRQHLLLRICLIACHQNMIHHSCKPTDAVCPAHDLLRQFSGQASVFTDPAQHM